MGRRPGLRARARRPGTVLAGVISSRVIPREASCRTARLGVEEPVETARQARPAADGADREERAGNVRDRCLPGIVADARRLGLSTGHVLGRTHGVVAAFGSSVSNFPWLPYQPGWSSVLLALGVAVIWALTAHGRDVVAE